VPVRLPVRVGGLFIYEFEANGQAYKRGKKGRKLRRYASEFGGKGFLCRKEKTNKT